MCGVTWLARVFREHEAQFKSDTLDRLQNGDSMDSTSDTAITSLDDVIVHLSSKDSDSIETFLSMDDRLALYRQIAIAAVMAPLNQDPTSASKLDTQTLSRLVGYFSELVKAIGHGSVDDDMSSDLN